MYDAATQEFVINTPRHEASKIWIGGTGQHGKVTVVTNATTGDLEELIEEFGKEKDWNKATNKFLVYRPIETRPKGFYLPAEEQLPLPQTLTLIANDIRATLPMVTNRLQVALDTVNPQNYGMGSFEGIYIDATTGTRSARPDTRRCSAAEAV